MRLPFAAVTGRAALAKVWLLAVAAALCLPAEARIKTVKQDPDKLPVTRVRDLHYGDGLFYFYQGESFEALTRLSAYDSWQRLPNHQAETQLLLGGLYLELGMHNEAGARFEKLLTMTISASVRNRAWFYLGKVWYARGYDDRSEAALRKVTGKLAPALEAEKIQLLANVMMRGQRFAEAAALLQEYKGPADWAAYARFNLGVAFVRDNKLTQAEPFLTQVGTMDTSRSEFLALKDKANLALGFAYLQGNEPAKAKPVLERVRLNGPFSSKALLGVGWAAAALDDYKGALVPWSELHDRNLLDAAVQESYLAVPYAYGRLGANAQAAEYYEGAVKSFADESSRIDAAVERIRGGKLLDDMLEHEAAGQTYGWFWQMKNVPDAPESRYLYTILAGNDFQEGLKNYRDLAFLDRTLARWTDNLAAYTDMIDTRQKAFAERLPRADALLAEHGADKLMAQRTALVTSVAAAESSGDPSLLGTEEERGQWQRIARTEAAVAAQPESEERAALRNRLRLVKGVLFYRMSEQYRRRSFTTKRELGSLETLLRETETRWQQLSQARAAAPDNTTEFSARVTDIGTRLEDLRKRLALARVRQSQFLAGLAVNELLAQKDRLSTYQIQARFALATIYDRAAAPAVPKVPADGAAPADPGAAPTMEPAPAPPPAAPAPGNGLAP